MQIKRQQRRQTNKQTVKTLQALSVEHRRDVKACAQCGRDRPTITEGLGLQLCAHRIVERIARADAPLIEHELEHLPLPLPLQAATCTTP